MNNKNNDFSDTKPWKFNFNNTMPFRANLQEAANRWFIKNYSLERMLNEGLITEDIVFRLYIKNSKKIR